MESLKLLYCITDRSQNMECEGAREREAGLSLAVAASRGQPRPYRSRFPVIPELKGYLPARIRW